jgi:PAS domain S-box-containing protein
MSEASENEVVILHLEDNPMDRKMVEKTLQSEGISCRLISCETQSQFENALQQGGFQLMLVDYQLPGFDGLQAMEMALKECPEVPFVFLSGVLGEEAAIESLKGGATDYVLKQRMERLAPAVRRAVHEAEEHQQREAAEAAARRSEARFRVFMDNLPGLAFIKDRGRKWVWFNRRWNDILTGGIEKYLGTDLEDFLPEHTAQSAKEIEFQVFQSGMPADTTEEFGPGDDPDRKWLVTRFLLEQADEPALLGGVALDITGRVQAEAELAAEKNRLQQLVDHNLALLAEHDVRLS